MGAVQEPAGRVEVAALAGEVGEDEIAGRFAKIVWAGKFSENLLVRLRQPRCFFVPAQAGEQERELEAAEAVERTVGPPFGLVLPAAGVAEVGQGTGGLAPQRAGVGAIGVRHAPCRGVLGPLGQAQRLPGGFRSGRQASGQEQDVGQVLVAGGGVLPVLASIIEFTSALVTAGGGIETSEVLQIQSPRRKEYRVAGAEGLDVALGEAGEAAFLLAQTPPWPPRHQSHSLPNCGRSCQSRARSRRWATWKRGLSSLPFIVMPASVARPEDRVRHRQKARSLSSSRR